MKKLIEGNFSTFLNILTTLFWNSGFFYLKHHDKDEAVLIGSTYFSSMAYFQYYSSVLPSER